MLAKKHPRAALAHGDDADARRPGDAAALSLRIRDGNQPRPGTQRPERTAVLGPGDDLALLVALALVRPRRGPAFGGSMGRPTGSRLPCLRAELPGPRI